MNSIKEAIDSKPSKALRYMIDGLNRQSQRPDFRINMGTYGETNGQICFGCAATSTIQQIFQIDFRPYQEIDLPSYRGELLDVSVNELRKFEETINYVRYGDLKYLFRFCDIDLKFVSEDILDFLQDNSEEQDGFYMMTNNWQTYIPTLEQLIEKLEEVGY